MAPESPMPASLGALPGGFRFGTVTAAYQIEGAVAEDGRGPSIWDAYAAEPGRIADGSTASTAADHYHRVDEDIALLKDLGAPEYKFSISWPRVLPSGKGAVNAKGLDFYDRLVDKLVEAHIDPVVTLHHWDLPQALEDDGGWLNRSTVDAFAEYAGIVGERLADRVDAWVPIAEPAVMVFRGYATGEGAPGRRALFDALPAAHHSLLAHGRAVIELRRAGAQIVGCANNHSPMWPASDDPADVGATKLFDALWNGLFLEPMLLGRYPGDLAMLQEEFTHPGDLATIRQPLDFYGVNYYSPLRVGAADEDSDTPFRFVDVLGHRYTDAGWAVVPDALREWLVMTRARFRAAMPPIVITECGAAVAADPDENGVVDDQDRIDYLAAHIEAVAAAVDRGVDVRAFFAYTLLDSWEWAQGFLPQYGLVHVDQQTKERTKKRSFQWYADLVAAHRAQV
ncbi:GH1 family beta-glucosidase [Nocardioides panacisoli]|uniref:Beta-glucosidase n=1 Tax=Nocardioides panacisoli TaxID=627624 RepID=A0ABP7IJD1_9ACTN